MLKFLRGKNFSKKINATENLINICRNTIKEIKDAGTYKSEKSITSPQSVKIQVNGKIMLNFCSNNYLGFTDNRILIDEAKRALDTRGYGMSSVRFICGTQDLHKQLEHSVSTFHNKEDAILYSSCFDANAGLFEALLSEKDAIISDSLNHASIIDGIRLCKAKRLRYKHLDLADLEEQLKQAEDSRIKMIVTDGVFSMDGDIAPLDKIVNIAQKYNANIMIDECHSTGFLGRTGRGTPELFGVEDHIDIINSTLGKALGGGSGGYTTGNKEIIELLRQRSRPYLFSNSLVPAICAASIKVFEILGESVDLVKKLQDNTTLFRTEMKKLGFTILGSPECPIVPVLLKEERLATEFGEEMANEGIYVVGFSYPVVPKGQARIRVQISAAHSFEQIKLAVKAFEIIGKRKNII